jgi:hypothetical protein
MRGLLAIVLGIALFSVGYAAGNSNQATAPIIETNKPCQINEERSVIEAYNANTLRLYSAGQISEQQANQMFMPTATKTAYIPFNVPGWGMITFHKYDPFPNDPEGSMSCTQWRGENEYGCGIEEDSHVKCGIIVEIQSGPLAGKMLFLKSCDGTPISERSTFRDQMDTSSIMKP